MRYPLACPYNRISWLNIKKTPLWKYPPCFGMQCLSQSKSGKALYESHSFLEVFFSLKTFRLYLLPRDIQTLFTDNSWELREGFGLHSSLILVPHYSINYYKGLSCLQKHFVSKWQRLVMMIRDINCTKASWSGVNINVACLHSLLTTAKDMQMARLLGSPSKGTKNHPEC